MRIKLSTLLLILAVSCIEPYSVFEDFTPAIVVQGMITDKPGPYLISISKTIPVQVLTAKVGETYFPGAAVKITDSNGYSENLIEKSPGAFYTQNIQGAVGTSYFITLTTSEGNVYESTVETMIPVSDFSLHSKFVLNTDPLDQNIDSIRQGYHVPKLNGFDVFLNTNFLPEQQGKVWWRGTGTWQITTFPGSRRDSKGAPNAPSCAGISTGLCTCCDCWITEYNSVPLIADNRLSSSVNDFKVWFVVANRRTLYDHYHLEIEQLSLSSGVYAFWKSVQIQQSNSNNLFQVPPPKTPSNFKALTAGAMPIIGYFVASSSKTHSLDFRRSDVPYKVYDIDFIKQSCLDTYLYDQTIQHITNKRPLFW